MEIDEEFIRKYLDGMANQIKNTQITAIIPGEAWWSDIPPKAGVYAIYERDRLVYCGETADMRERMRDLGDTRHHTLRRHVGNREFINRENFCKVSSKVKFPVDLEKELDRHMQNFSVRALPVALGRKELESWMIKRHDPEFNRVARRGSS